MAFKYNKRSAKDHKKRTVKQAGSWATLAKPEFPEFKPKEGPHTIRLCPPTWEDAKHWGLDLWVNGHVGSGFGETFLSLKMMRQEADPVAEAIAAAKSEGEGRAVKGLEPYKKVGVWIIEKGNEDVGPQFYAMPQTLDVDIAALAYDDEDSSEVLWIDDPKKGHWVSFKIVKEKTPTGDFPKYREVKVHTRDADQLDEWLEFIEENSIPDILNFYSYDHIKSALAGADKPAKDEDEDDDEAPSRRRSRKSRERDDDDGDDEDKPPPRKRRSKIDDEDEDLDEEPPKAKKRRKKKAAEDDPDEDGDEDDEPPKAKKRKRRSKAELDEEFEDEDDEDDEPPKAKKRRKKKAAEPEEDEEDEEDDEETRAPKKRKRKASKDDEDDKDLRKSGGLKRKRRRRSEEDDD